MTPLSTPLATTGARAWRLAALLPFVALAVLVLTVSAADASCVGGASVQETIRTAPTVFVGTVTDLSSGGRVATVRVDDVWRGNGIPSSVDVVGTADLNAAATSVDRIYVAGSQYLFVPDGGGPQHFSDNNCTATQVYSGNLGAMRPAGAPGRPPRSASALPLVLIIMAVLLALAGVGGAVILRRRRF